MKKSTTSFIILLLIVLITLTVIMIFIATGIFDKYSVENPNVSFTRDNEEIYVEFPIQKGSIEVYADLVGSVIYSDGVIDIVVSEPETAEILCQVGDDIAKEKTPLYVSSEKIYNSPVDGKILSIKNNVIQILDFNASYISVNVPSEYQKKINYSNKITATADGESANIQIESIFPTISQNVFQVLLNNPFHIFDGTLVDVYIPFETKENVLLVNKLCIHEDSDGSFYLNILNDNGTVSKTQVEIGMENPTVVEIKNADNLNGKTAVVSKEELLLKGE